MQFSSSIVNIITAVGSLFTACAIALTAWRLLIPLLAETRKVHRIVNQQRTDMERYQRALVAALKHAGVDVPVDQSIEDPPELTPPA